MKLQEAITRAGHTQRTLAVEAGLSDTAINFIINGKRVPRGPTMKKILAVLNRNLDDIDEFRAALEKPPRRQKKAPVTKVERKITPLEELELLEAMLD